jgi:hypothetical protein
MAYISGKTAGPANCIRAANLDAQSLREIR